LQAGVDNRDRRACPAEAATREALPQQYRQDKDWNGGRRQRGKTPVNRKHHREDAEDGNHVANRADQALAEQVLQHVYVALDAGHDAAGLVTVEEFQRQLGNVAEHVARHVVKGELADTRHLIGLLIGGEPTDQGQTEEQPDD